MDAEPLAAAEAAKHVTIWNRHEHRKIAGNAAPLRRNLDRYLKKHPECEEYTGQDKDPNRAPIDPITGERLALVNEHVPIWHTLENRKVTGNAAPLRKNLEAYLKKHPHCEVYDNQDKLPRNNPSFSTWPPIINGQPPARITSTARVSSSNYPHASKAAPARRASHPRHKSSVTPVLSQTTPSVSSALHNEPPNDSAALRNSLYENIYPQAASMRSLQHHANDRQPSSTSAQPLHSTFTTGSPIPSPDMIPATSPRSMPRATSPTYHDMVSSWSNQPEWTRQESQPVSTGFIATHPVGTPVTSGLYSSPCYPAAVLDSADNVAGIPIPGSGARERPDIVMGVSMGASFGTSANANMDFATYLGMTPTPQSMDHESDAMQFSPSSYLVMGPSIPSPIPGSSSPHHNLYNPFSSTTRPRN